MTTAYSYSRWSSAKQTEGTSSQRQSEAATAYCREHRLTLSDKTYVDAGVSAFKGKNAEVGELSLFRRAVEEGKIPKGSYLLIENFDRLSRAPVNQALRLFQDIIDSGITIVTLTDGAVYNESKINENWTSLIIALSVMARAHEEQKRKGGMVKKAWDIKRADQLKGVIASSKGPAWLQLSEDRKKWLVIPEKVKLVKRIYALALKGNGSLKIATILNDEGAKTFLSAEDWTPGNISALLRQEAVTGLYKQTHGDLVIPSYYPEIVSKEDFDAVQAGRKKRIGTGGQHQGTSNLFSSMTFCAYCGSRMRYQVSGRNPNRIPYLACMKSQRKGHCTSRMMPYEPMERAILDRLINRQARDLTPWKLKEDHDTIEKQLQQSIISKQAELDKLLKLAMLAPDVVVIATQMEKAQEEMDELQAKLVSSREEPVSEAEIEAGQVLFKRLTTTKDDGVRLEVATAIRRQLTKIEVAARMDDMVGYRLDVQKLTKNGQYEWSETARHAAILHYAGGSVRAVQVE